MIHEKFQLHVTIVAWQALFKQKVDNLEVDVHLANSELLHADADEEDSAEVHCDHGPREKREQFARQVRVMLRAIFIDVGFALLVVRLSKRHPYEHEYHFTYEGYIGAVHQNAIVVAPSFPVLLRWQFSFNHSLDIFYAGFYLLYDSVNHMWLCYVLINFIFDRNLFTLK